MSFISSLFLPVTFTVLRHFDLESFETTLSFLLSHIPNPYLPYPPSGPTLSPIQRFRSHYWIVLGFTQTRRFPSLSNLYTLSLPYFHFFSHRSALLCPFFLLFASILIYIFIFLSFSYLLPFLPFPSLSSFSSFFSYQKFKKTIQFSANIVFLLFNFMNLLFAESS